jgi:hypothetical protein
VKYATLLALLLGLSGCATYNYAQNMKFVAFDDAQGKGKSIGNIRGEDCTWQVLGYQLGGLPTVDRAVQNARHQEVSDLTKKKSDTPLRYINNMSTQNDGFNAGVVAKTCIVVTGVGYL